jgi:hypothetical protein
MSGSGIGVFDTWEQAVVFPATAERIVQVNNSGRSMQPVAWAVPKAGATCRLAAWATGGARLRLQLRDPASGAFVADSSDLGDGEAATFVWPDRPVVPQVTAISGIGQPSRVRGELKVVVT